MTHEAYKCKVTLKLWDSITEVEKISSSETCISLADLKTKLICNISGRNMHDWTYRTRLQI